MTRQGQSSHTPKKQMDLLRLYGMLLNIWAMIDKRHGKQRYSVFDMNAGSGMNDDAKCAGSPVLFLEASALHDVDIDFHFIDINELFIASLNSALESRKADRSRVHVHCGDNRELLPVLIRDLKPWSRGIVYHDNNGSPDIELLGQVFDMPNTDRIDCLIHLNAAAIKRAGKYRLENCLSSIHKKYILIQEPRECWQWSFLYLTNFDKTKDYPGLKMFRIDSPAGIRIFEKLNYTAVELATMGQGNLFAIQNV